MESVTLLATLFSLSALVLAVFLALRDIRRHHNRGKGNLPCAIWLRNGK